MLLYILELIFIMFLNYLILIKRKKFLSNVQILQESFFPSPNLKNI